MSPELMASIENIEIKLVKGLAAAEELNSFYKTHGSTSKAREIDTFFVAYSKDEAVLGAVRFCVENGTPLLRSMRVHSDFRRQKVGLKLLNAFENFLDQNELKKTYCLPFTHLEEFYSRIGFKKIPETTAPVFLQERMAEYRKRQFSVICMVRF